MTFQEAQSKFSTIVGGITPASTPAQLLEIQNRLLNLENSLPNTAEFDPIVDAITAVNPQLVGQLTQKILDDLHSRTAALTAATALLNQTAAAATADARVLTFEKPKLIAAGLTGCIATVRDLRTSLNGSDLATAAAKAEALLAQLTQLETTIKAD